MKAVLTAAGYALRQQPANEQPMTETVISSKSKTVIISPERSFTIIGERINPTGRKKLAAEMSAGNFDRVVQDALAQVAAGAHILDVNAGIPLTDEPAILANAIRIVQSITDVPISIDSSIVAALESGLQAYEGKALVNSVTGEDERLESVLPLIKKYGAAVIGISNDETGISEDPEVRLAVARKIIERAQDHGIPKEDVLIDPLVMPIGAMRYAGRQVFSIVGRCRDELGVNTCCGASNVSFGLPNRAPLNGTFLSMAIAAGLTSAITNPIETEIKTSILAANVMMGHDENCITWIQGYRPDAAAGGSQRSRRTGRRERR
jgi:5-methyltetrahydrofolate--homocysteine methyltransferase